MKQKLHFSERLRNLRDSRGLTNAELGKAVGLSHVSIGNFLEGQLPKSEYLVALAQFFGVSTDWLVGNDIPKISNLRETGPEYLMDDAIAALEDLKEKVYSLERALQRMKAEREHPTADRAESTAQTKRKG